ncbi:lasso peptide biosynthesis B2 protein [Nostoc sp. UHCC 0702]|nr:lasso peptide biosynthesis B2 protein [Nostoc sp. UHCC 0702]
MKRLRKFLNFTASDRYLLLSAAFILGAVRLGLWLLSFQTLQQVLARLTQATSKPQTLDESSIDKIVWAVNVASYYMPGHVKCLARALTTQTLLNQYGYSPELRIGVAKGDKGKFEAHAWVEHQEKVVIGNLTDLARFTPMPSFECCTGRDDDLVVSHAAK